jgi:hypothetical protein
LPDFKDLNGTEYGQKQKIASTKEVDIENGFEKPCRIQNGVRAGMWALGMLQMQGDSASRQTLQYARSKIQ